MTFRFRKRDGADERGHELETEELKVVVSSLLPEEAENLEIHEIAPPVELPKNAAPGLALAGRRRGGARGGDRAAGAPGAPQGAERGGPAAARRTRSPSRSSRRWWPRTCPEAGRIKEFYQRISDILRHYIENRFGLHAPERTTEEFLVELKPSEVLDARSPAAAGRTSSSTATS